MPTAQEYQDARETIARYVDAIGDEIDDEVVGIETEKGDEVEGYNCRHGNLFYLILGNSNREYFEIVYFHSLIEDIAEQFDEGQAKRLVDGQSTESELYIEAARNWINSIDSEDMDQLVHHLTRQITSTETSLVVSRTDSGGLLNFQVLRKIFPFDDGFSLTEFNHSIQAVASVGNRGSTFLSTSFSVDQDGVDQEYGVVLDSDAISE